MPHEKPIVREPLYGHTSQETAYVVDDYPYGRTLRCKIRYWLEDGGKRGVRLVSQTTNPKRPTEVWNKPKASTYGLIAGCMYLNEQGHVHWFAVTEYSDAETVLWFLQSFPRADRLPKVNEWIMMKMVYTHQSIKGKVRILINGQDTTTETDIERWEGELAIWTEALATAKSIERAD